MQFAFLTLLLEEVALLRNDVKKEKKTLLDDYQQPSSEPRAAAGAGPHRVPLSCSIWLRVMFLPPPQPQSQPLHLIPLSPFVTCLSRKEVTLVEVCALRGGMDVCEGSSHQFELPCCNIWLSPRSLGRAGK